MFDASAYNYRNACGGTEHTLHYQRLAFSAIRTLFDADNDDATVVAPF